MALGLRLALGLYRTVLAGISGPPPVIGDWDISGGGSQWQTSGGLDIWQLSGG